MPPALALFFLAAASPEQRAVDYLAVEVPRWSRENHCFSCHNNGDAARALYTAGRLGYTLPKAALDDTTTWLRQPANWENHHGNPGFSDMRLAHIQFAAALAEARIGSPDGLAAAAHSLLPYQDADGSWRVDTGGLPGAPATYGITLATYMARRTLEAADAARFSAPIARANRWLLASQPASILDASTLLLALPRSPEIRGRCLAAVLGAQTSDGGWGPQPHTPAEAFDTAIAILALDGLHDPAVTAHAIARGRAFLIARQLPGGGWQETTRPRGQQSYAEHISTTGWALYALLLTDPKRQ